MFIIVIIITICNSSNIKTVGLVTLSQLLLHLAEIDQLSRNER